MITSPIPTEASSPTSRSPLIGITGPRLQAAEIGSTPRILLHAWIDSHYTYYPQAVALAGGLPVHLPRENDPVALIERLDGLVVAGGQDVDPHSYGSQPTSTTSRLDPGRDAFELGLIRAAVASEVPVLGICRGAQLMNVAFGGGLNPEIVATQGLEHARHIYPLEARIHSVSCEPGSIVYQVHGASIDVNSFHHQGISELGEGISVTGLAPDGVIEAIEVEAPVGAVGVQWHPEMLGAGDPLFDWLVETASMASERSASSV